MITVTCHNFKLLWQNDLSSNFQYIFRYFEKLGKLFKMLEVIALIALFVRIKSSFNLFKFYLKTNQVPWMYFQNNLSYNISHEALLSHLSTEYLNENLDSHMSRMWRPFTFFIHNIYMYFASEKRNTNKEKIVL